jgi:hypothetical protein
MRWVGYGALAAFVGGIALISAGANIPGAVLALAGSLVGIVVAVINAVRRVRDTTKELF